MMMFRRKIKHRSGMEISEAEEGGSLKQDRQQQHFCRKLTCQYFIKAQKDPGNHPPKDHVHEPPGFMGNTNLVESLKTIRSHLSQTHNSTHSWDQ